MMKAERNVDVYVVLVIDGDPEWQCNPYPLAVYQDFDEAVKFAEGFENFSYDSGLVEVHRVARYPEGRGPAWFADHLWERRWPA